MQTISTIALGLAAALLPVTSVFAQEDPAQTESSADEMEAEPLLTGWFSNENGLSVHHSGVTAPIKFGAVSYNEREAAQSQKDGLDNIISYSSSDGSIFATIYVYRPALADAAMNAVLTQSAVQSGFGADGDPSFRSLMPFGETSNGAIIFGYAATEKGYTTTAGLAEVDGWIVKMRVSGPESQEGDVVDTLRAGMAAIKVDADSTVTELSLDLPQSCNNRLKGKAKRVKLKQEDSMANALMGSLLSGLTIKNDNDDEKTDGLINTVSRGFSSWCIADDYMIADNRYYVYRTEDTPDGMIVAPYADTGASFATGEAFLQEGELHLIRYDIGEINNFGNYRGQFSAKQIRDILTGDSDVIGPQTSSTNINADGSTNINIIAN